VWPKKIQGVLGAGGTHGELCVRFSSEDIREPIIKDNLLDDDILREHFEKNRLDEWFIAACRTGKKAYEAEKRQQMTASQEQADTVGTDEDSVQPQGDEETTGEDADIVEEAGSDTFEGDVESVADQDHDVEMQES
jgi:nuclear pore complex protein Nup133